VDSRAFAGTQLPKKTFHHNLPKIPLGNGSSQLVLLACPQFTIQFAQKDLLLMRAVRSGSPPKWVLGSKLFTASPRTVPNSGKDFFEPISYEER
jgi:hypothetical protein